MKIRMGFVSNSSSCSFCICGTPISEEEANKLEKPITDAKLKMEGRWDDYSDIWVGLPPEAQDMNETRAQFENRIIIQLKEAGIEVESVVYQTDGWYAG